MLEKLLSIFAGEVVDFRTWVILFVTKTQKKNYLPAIINEDYIPANSSIFTYIWEALGTSL